MTKLRWGATLWILGLLILPAQIISAAAWPERYSWSSNFISDLGVTTCGAFDVGTRVERYICSPAHLLANGSTVANGVFLTAGAILLWSAWPRPRSGRVAMVFLAAGGLLVIAVGLLPWDLQPAAHDVTALAQAGAQWIGMIILVLALRGTASRWASALTAVSVLVSVLGFVLFIDAIGGGPSLALGLGLTERIAFDTLTLWGAAMGLGLLVTSVRRRSAAGWEHASHEPQPGIHAT